ncbi:MAG: response regulator [Acidobacteria bacterium]|nr:response regulator [Acidobacteriota bacterium]
MVEQHARDFLANTETTSVSAIDLLKEGIANAKSGNKAQARSLLLQSLSLNSNSEMAWLWLAWIAESPKEAVLYLEKVLELNAANQQAIQWLNKIRHHKAQETPVWKCPICLVNFPTKESKCPNCRSIILLSDINQILSNEDVDKSILNQAAERFENIVYSGEIRSSGSHSEAEFHINMGLVYLNMKVLDKGLLHLQNALYLHEDANLRTQVEALISILKQIKERGRSPSQKQEKIVMIIDDSPTVRKLVAITLERVGYRVIAVSDGVQSLAKIEETVPDLILLDISMPYMDGYQVCKLLKSDTKTKHIPILMLSGKDGFIDKVRARLAGSSGHISKPVDPGTLLAMVQKHVVTNK